MLQTLEEYSTYHLSSRWMKEFKELSRQRDIGKLSEASYYEKIDTLAESLTTDEKIKLRNAFQRDFSLPRFSFTNHFIGRLFARFSKSIVSFLMERIGRLMKLCRRKKRERSESDDILLVMDPNNSKLLTIFAR